LQKNLHPHRFRYTQIVRVGYSDAKQWPIIITFLNLMRKVLLLDLLTLTHNYIIGWATWGTFVSSFNASRFTSNIHISDISVVDEMSIFGQIHGAGGQNPKLNPKAECPLSTYGHNLSQVLLTRFMNGPWLNRFFHILKLVHILNDRLTTRCVVKCM